MEPSSPLIYWVNPFPSRFINRTTFFCSALESQECACCLLFDGRQYCHFSIFIGSFLYQRVKPPQGTVLFINLLGKVLTPRACMGDGGSMWWAPVAIYDLSDDRRINDVTVNFFTSLFCKTNRFHVAVRLFSKWGKNKRVAHEPLGECVTDVLTKFWRLTHATFFSHGRQPEVCCFRIELVFTPPHLYR